MVRALTIEELARRVGQPPEQVHAWCAAGLLGAADDPRFSEEDVERARLYGALSRRGMVLEQLAELVRSGVVEQYLTAYVVPRLAGGLHTLEDAAAVTGLPLSLVERIWAAIGCGTEELVDADDLAVLSVFRAVRETGHPDDAIVQTARVLADGIRRITETEVRLFQFHVVSALREGGDSAPTVMAEVREQSRVLRQAAERILVHLSRRFMREAARENMGLAPDTAIAGELQVGILFIDLSSFTALAEAMGDQRSAEVLDRFSVVVRRGAQLYGGRVVKQIGDAFMLAFPEARAAVACALEIARGVADEPQFPAVRAGVHWGRALYREGDYVGASVNLAARVATAAERHQVLVTAAARREAGELAGAVFVPLPRRRFKGVADAVELFEVRPAEPAPEDRVVDPVCGMELRPSEVAVRLTVAGREHAFCSETCLERFVAAPKPHE